MTYEQFINNLLDTRGRWIDKKDKERHHILPKCLGGTNEDENLIDLEFGEHFTAHRLLAEENPDCLKLQHAFKLMSHVYRVDNVTEIATPEEYAKAKLANKHNLIKTNYGKEIREEVKHKISIANTGKKRTPEMCEAIRKRLNEYYETHSGWSKGKTLSEEHKAALREGHKHRDPSTYKGGAKTQEGKAAAVEKFKQTYWSKPEEVRKEQARKAAENREPPRYWQGKEIPQEMRDKISQTLKDKHLCPPHARKVYCEETDAVYRSFTEAEQATGVDRHIIKKYVDGKRKDSKHHFRLV